MLPLQRPLCAALQLGPIGLREMRRAGVEGCAHMYSGTKMIPRSAVVRWASLQLKGTLAAPTTALHLRALATAGVITPAAALGEKTSARTPQSESRELSTKSSGWF